MALFLLSFYETLPVFWKQLKGYTLLHFDIAEAIMICLTKQMNSFSY